MNLNFEEGEKISNQHNKDKDSQPYNIQILLNFNSKNIVNNNIVPQQEELYKIRNKNLNINRIKNQKNQKPFIFPSKTPQMTVGHLFRKKKDKKFDQCQISNEKNDEKQVPNIASQSKNNKKNKSHSASMIQQNKPNKKIIKKKSLQFIQTPQFHQIHKSRQVKCKSVLQKKLMNKNLRQTLLQLMIKDYEKGAISAQNFKQAVSSLIDDQIFKKKEKEKEISGFKSQIKSNNTNNNTKTKTTKHSHTPNNNSANTSCIRYSYTTSLKNTPKHKKPHSKSQKFYKLHHKQQKQKQKPSSYFNLKKDLQNQDDDQKDCDFLQQQMTERVIEKKQFLNKIIIKGINSSLFLNNDKYDDQRSKYQDSPNKQQQQPVQVYNINTSDSVRQLKRQMMKISQINNEQQQKNKNNALKNQSFNSSKMDKNSLQNRMAMKIQKAWRCYQTKKLLYKIHAQIRYIDSINYRNLHQNDQGQNQNRNHNQNQIRTTNSTNYSNNLGFSHQNNQSNYNSIIVVQNDSDVQNQQFIQNQYQNQFQNQNEVPQNQSQEDQEEAELQVFEQLQTVDKNYMQQMLKDSQKRQNKNKKQHRINYYKSQSSEQGKINTQELEEDGPSQSRVLVFQKSPLFQQFQKNNQHQHQHEYSHQFNKSDKEIEKFMSSQLVDYKKKSENSLDKKLYKQKFDNIKNVELQKWDQVMDYVKYYMENSQISKQQCLNNIVQYFQNEKKNVQDQLSISKSIFPKISNKKMIEYSIGAGVDQIIDQKCQSSSFDLLNSSNKKKYQKQKQNKIANNNSLSKKTKLSKHQKLQIPKQQKNNSKSQSQSSDLQLSQQLSFCNSIIVFNNNQEYLQQLISEKSKEMVKQLKTINVDCIQQTFRKRQKQLNDKRDKDIHSLTDRFINDKINAGEFQAQKDRLQKWFSLEMKQLKKTRKKFLKSIKQAKQVIFRPNFGIQQQTINFQDEKQSRMIKCLSQSYLNFRNQSTQNYSVLNSINNSFSHKKKSNKSSSQSQQTQKQKQKQKIKPTIKKLIIKSNHHNDVNSNQQTKQILNLKERQKQKQRSRNNKNFKQLTQTQQNQQELQRFLLNQQSLEKEQNQQFFIQISNNDQMLLSGKFLENHEIYSPVLSSEGKQQVKSNEDLDENVSQQPQSPKIIFNTFQSNKKSVNLFQKSNQFQFQFDTTPNHKQKYEELSKQFDEYEMSNNQSDQDITLGDNINEFNKLFKNLNIEDKEDIFQFLFLDLCLQLFIEQQKNSKIIKSVQSYIKFLRKQRKTPKGIKTSYETCRRYLAKFMVYLRDKNFQYLNRLQFPMGPTAKQMLKYMRESLSEDDSYSNSSQSLENNISIILPIQIFEKFQSLAQNQLIIQPVYENSQKQKQRVLFLNSVFHIFNKAMFDSLNESLDHQRSYGIWGKPFPWKKTMIVDRKFDQQTKENKLKKAIQKVVQNCSYLCGVMPDKQDSVFGNSKVSIQYVQRIREDRMSRMLSNQLLDNQDRWIFYDDQQTQILINISKHVTTLLIYEVLLDLKKILR